MAIDRLNQGALSAASQVPFYDAANGGDARASITALATLLATLLGAGSIELTQYAAPNATGFSITVTPVTPGASVWLKMAPLAGYAAGTVTLPELSTCQHGQEVTVCSTQAVTTLTVAGNWATVNGAPTTLAANGYFRMKFDDVSDSWSRVG